jgi:hypothetical protein
MAGSTAASSTMPSSTAVSSTAVNSTTVLSSTAATLLPQPAPLQLHRAGTTQHLGAGALQGGQQQLQVQAQQQACLSPYGLCLPLLLLPMPRQLPMAPPMLCSTSGLVGVQHTWAGLGLE